MKNFPHSFKFIIHLVLHSISMGLRDDTGEANYVPSNINITVDYSIKQILKFHK